MVHGSVDPRPVVPGPIFRSTPAQPGRLTRLHCSSLVRQATTRRSSSASYRCNAAAGWRHSRRSQAGAGTPPLWARWRPEAQQGAARDRSGPVRVSCEVVALRGFRVRLRHPGLPDFSLVPGCRIRQVVPVSRGRRRWRKHAIRTGMQSHGDVRALGLGGPAQPDCGSARLPKARTLLDRWF